MPRGSFYGSNEQVYEEFESSVAAAAAAEASAAAALASQTAAAASASAAATSATAAAGSEAAVDADATAAAASAAAAAASATAADASEADAEAAASAAATSETNAATSASNAATSATNAASSATAAAASATAAAASFDAFDDIYLGSKASDPTLDNDGNALVEGQLYWNSSINSLKVYDGASWGAYSASGGDMLGANNLSDVANVATARDNLGVEIGVDVAPATSGSAILKGNGSGGFSNAASGTDYAPATSGSAILKGNGSGGFSNAASGTDYAPATSGSAIQKGNGSGGFSAAAAGTDYCAATSGSGVLKGSSGNTAAATAGTDFVKPDTSSAFTAQQSFTLATLTDGANISWDVSTKQKAKVTLGGNRTMNAVSNAVEGTTYYLWVIQDGTGSRTISWTTSGAGGFDFGTDGAPVLTTTASKADLLCFEAISIASTLKLRFTGIRRGFA
jgi:hypothetical protein